MNIRIFATKRKAHRAQRAKSGTSSQQQLPPLTYPPLVDAVWSALARVSTTASSLLEMPSAYPVLPEIPKCPQCQVAYSEDRVPLRFACREHDCCQPCAAQLANIGISKCPQCRMEIGTPTTDRWLLRLSLFVRKAREAQRKRLRDGKPLTIEAKNAIEQAYGYLENLFGPNGLASDGKIPNSNEIPSVPQVQEIECVMCLEVFSDGRKPVRLSCNHCVCAECSGDWTANCPKCRASCNQNEVEVDESLLAMSIFYTDLADTVEDARLNRGATSANKDVLDVLRELHAYTKRVLYPPQDAPPLVNSVGAGSDVASVRNGAAADDEAAAEEEFQRQLSQAIAASVAQEPQRPSREEEEEEEREFQRRLREAMQASVDEMRREHTLAREQARRQPPPAYPPPSPPLPGQPPSLLQAGLPAAAAGAASRPHPAGAHALPAAQAEYPAEEEEVAMFCLQCGTQAVAVDRFCMECGCSLRDNILLQPHPRASPLSQPSPPSLPPSLPPSHALDLPSVAAPASVQDWLASVAAAPPEDPPAAAASGTRKKGVMHRLSFGLIKGSASKARV